MKLFIQALVSSILLGCLLHMPYGYYQFVRLAVCIAMGWLAYMEKEKPALVLACIGIAILFNPIFKVYLNKHDWNVIDIAIATLLIMWALYLLHRS